ncbi:MAG: HAD-IIIA family hydrolase [Sphingobacteriales bacterium]|nr:MAG: HAD-IIIA family hydrolase [Sphingobacteriales bacterium]
MFQFSDITTDWTLFLDRDGVINYEKKDDYIYNWEEFKMYDGVLQAMQRFAQKFGNIILVTNQRGVSKGLMTEAALMDIHNNFIKATEAAGGRLDAVYYCTALSADDANRKPNPGMALQAKADNPDIDFSKSIMVGNKLSDMNFGRNAGMHTVYMQTTHPNQPLPHPAIDYAFKNLLNFAQAL